MTEATMTMEDLRPAPADLPADEVQSHYQMELSRVFPESGQDLERFKSWEPYQIVIKLGGGMVTSEAVALGLVVMQHNGLTPVVVHGGGDQIDQALIDAGHRKRDKVNGIRPTPPEHMTQVEAALDKVNDQLVGSIDDLGGQAVGLKRGVFGGFPMSADNYVLDRVSKVHTGRIRREARAGNIVIVSCVGSAPNGEAVNVNGDTAAAALARSLDAEKFLSVTPSGGVHNKAGDRVPKLTPTLAWELVKRRVIEEGMVPKIREADELVNNGVHDVVLTKDFMRELFTTLGEGTIYHRQ